MQHLYADNPHMISNNNKKSIAKCQEFQPFFLTLYKLRQVSVKSCYKAAGKHADRL